MARAAPKRGQGDHDHDLALEPGGPGGGPGRRTPTTPRSPTPVRGASRSSAGAGPGRTAPRPGARRPPRSGSGPTRAAPLASSTRSFTGPDTSGSPRRGRRRMATPGTITNWAPMPTADAQGEVDPPEGPAEVDGEAARALAPGGEDHAADQADPQPHLAEGLAADAQLFVAAGPQPDPGQDARQHQPHDQPEDDVAQPPPGLGPGRRVGVSRRVGIRRVGRVARWSVGTPSAAEPTASDRGPGRTWGTSGGLGPQVGVTTAGRPGGWRPGGRGRSSPWGRPGGRRGGRRGRSCAVPWPRGRRARRCWWRTGT